MGNLELSMHIDRIDGYVDGKVVMRTCRLGALTGVTDILAQDESVVSNARPNEVVGRIRPRRRGRFRVDAPIADKRDWSAMVDFATDPERFAGLDENWFWKDTFQVPEPTCWAKEHAADVAARRKAGLTEEKLAIEFGKSIPTIRSALKYAAEVDESLNELPKKMPRARWHEDHAEEVAASKATGMGTCELARHFQKSDTTIRAAIKHAATRNARGGAMD